MTSGCRGGGGEGEGGGGREGGGGARYNIMLYIKETLQANISKIFLSKSEQPALQSSIPSSIISSMAVSVHVSPQQLPTSTHVLASVFSA